MKHGNGQKLVAVFTVPHTSLQILVGFRFGIVLRIPHETILQVDHLIGIVILFLGLCKLQQFTSRIGRPALLEGGDQLQDIGLLCAIHIHLEILRLPTIANLVKRHIFLGR